MAGVNEQDLEKVIEAARAQGKEDVANQLQQKLERHRVMRYMSEENERERQRSQGGVIENTVKGVGRGLTGLAGLPGDLARLGRDAAPQGFMALERQKVFGKIADAFPGSREVQNAADLAVDKLGGDPNESIFQGGEDTYAGRVGEFIGAGAPFAAPGIARAFASQGIRATIQGNRAALTFRNMVDKNGMLIGREQLARETGQAPLRKFLTQNTAAGVGSKAAEDIDPHYGAIWGALAPGAANMALQYGVKRALVGTSVQQNQMAVEVLKQMEQGAKPTLAGSSDQPLAVLIERMLESAPGTGKLIINNAKNNMKAWHNRVKQLTKGVKKGDPRTDVEIGAILSEGLNNRSNKLKAYWQRMYDRAERMAEGKTNQLVSVDELMDDLGKLHRQKGGRYYDDLLREIAGDDDTVQKVFKALLERQKHRITTKGADFTETVATELPYQSIDDFRRAVGKKLTANKVLLSSADEAELMKLYDVFSKAQRRAANVIDKSGKLSETIRQANQRWTHVRKQHDNIINPIIKNNWRPEQIYQMVIGSNLKHATYLKETLKGLNPQQREHVVKTFMGKLGYIDDETGQVIESLFTPQRLIKNWERLAPDRKTILFGGNKELHKLREEMDNLVTTMRRQVRGARAYGNPEGTVGTGLAAATLFGTMSSISGLASFGVLGFAVPNALHFMTGAAGGALGVNLTTRLMVNPDFIRWLSQGVKLPPNRLAQHVSKLGPLINRASDPDAKAMDAYNTALMIHIMKGREQRNERRQREGTYIPVSQ